MKVTPTDINVDANGYAILEHDGTEITGQAKKVKFAQTDKSASFSEVTIPSASDLKTKDGTSLGGGLPEPWIADEHGIGFWAKSSGESAENDLFSGLISLGGEIAGLGSKGISNDYIAVFMPTFTSDVPLFGFQTTDNIFSQLLLPKSFFTETTIIDLGDIAKKQSILYRHTITIYEGNTQDGNSVCFTAYTPSNTPIDSIQDLTASADGSNKLANTDLACFGVSGTAEALVLYNGIHIGTDLASTTFRKAVGGSVAFSSAFATYTITDDVTLN